MANGANLEIIENSGPNNLRDALRAKLANASDVSIAVAFITESGLDEIIQSLRQAASRGKVRLLTGLYQRVTEPKALKTLLRVQRETRSNLSVRLSREPQFHRKIYLVENRTHANAIIGSSNLTREGLRSGGELCLMTSLSKSHRAYSRLKEVFEKDWHKRRAVPLTPDQIERYDKSRSASGNKDNYTANQLKKILGVDPKHEKAILKDEPITFWRDGITGYVKDRTEKIISESTNWDDKYYSWFGTSGQHQYRNGDRIFMFDFPANTFHLVEVKDMTRSSIPTPDGRHFVAFTRVGRRKRNMTNKFWNELSGFNIKKKNVRRTRKLRPSGVERLMSMLPTRKKRRRK
ncbi:phospholipase D-like domain-containing protein [Candidatus Manganitrophus noduliformans]|uniref:NgoFVII family restriction endonuclease n=1 Tax=Candidatus Manganitrophus noduliformans TaxID=2606439 RepID=A0A7X6ICL4_9BACT|nr:phospholipase D-like domain-containing protein [Candidatus Manganitrophus noduliformans]NKE72803.1 NgoFVII family restriction endonuclease [Candidatus Manganitrophus noduliformans]